MQAMNDLHVLKKKQAQQWACFFSSSMLQLPA